MITLPTPQALESSLVAAAERGPAGVYAALLTKIAELQLDAADRLAVLEAFEAVENGTSKVAGFNMGWDTLLHPNVIRGATLASLIAAPAAAGVAALQSRWAKQDAYQRLMEHAPDLAQQPERTTALFNLLHSSAPNVATNTPIAADVLRQMSAAPAMDLGTIGRLSEIRRNLSGGSEGGSWLKDGTDTMNSVGTAAGVLASGAWTPPKTAAAKLGSVKASHIALDGTPCFFDWGTEACKQAGLTDAFSGSGTPMQQAGQAFDLNSQAQQMPLLPLDAIVRELMAKEQELMQREEIIAQREAQMGGAQQMQGAMSQAYQDDYGVDTQTGQPMPQDPGMQQDPGQDPSMQQDPSQDPSMPPGQDPSMPPGQDPSMQQDPGQDPGMPPGQDPSMQQGPGQDPSMPPGQDPSMPPGQDPSMPPGQDPSMQQDPSMLQDPSQDPGVVPAPATPETDPGMPQPGMGSLVEGSQEDELDHHQGPSALPEGSPADVAADNALATQLAAQGQAPTPMSMQGGMLTVQVPLPTLTLSIKVAERLAMLKG